MLLNAIGHIGKSVQNEFREPQPVKHDGIKKAMTTKRIENCNYCSPSGAKCSQAVQPGEKKCLWHDVPSSTESPLKEKIEELVRENHSLAGFDLKKAELQDAGLIGADLENADLSRADLTGAHLYGANLRGANLFKANLYCANLRTANLVDCNLLGVNLEGTKLENAQWDKDYIVINEKRAIQAFRAGDRQTALKKFKEAEEIYRNLKLSYRLQGQGKYEGPFFYREMVVQRKQMRFFSLHRIWSKFIDLATGYGEKPTRVVLTMVCDIAIAAILYGLLGLKYGASHLSFWQVDLPAGELLLNLFYFSTVVFTTVGFGDITPTGASKIVMMLQGLSGQILIAFFIVALYKKLMSR